MHLVELHELLETGENDSIEFKRKFSSPEKIAKEMLAFANTKGGKLLFGVDDDKSIIGVESEKGELELIEMAARDNCDPPLEFTYDIVHIYRKDVVIVNIPESRKKPHRLIKSHSPDEINKVYIRLKDKSIIASKEMIRILTKSNPDSPPIVINLGDKEKFVIDYLHKYEKLTVAGLKSLLNISTRRASRILVNLVRANLIRHYPEMGSKNEDFFTLA